MFAFNAFAFAVVRSRARAFERLARGRGFEPQPLHFLLFSTSGFLLCVARLLYVKVHYRRNQACERPGKMNNHRVTRAQKHASPSARLGGPQLIHWPDSGHETRVCNQLRHFD